MTTALLHTFPTVHRPAPAGIDVVGSEKVDALSNLERVHQRRNVFAEEWRAMLQEVLHDGTWARLDGALQNLDDVLQQSTLHPQRLPALLSRMRHRLAQAMEAAQHARDAGNIAEHLNLAIQNDTLRVDGPLWNLESRQWIDEIRYAVLHGLYCLESHLIAEKLEKRSEIAQKDPHEVTPVQRWEGEYAQIDAVCDQLADTLQHLRQSLLRS